MAGSSTFHPYGKKGDKVNIRLTDTFFCNFISLSDNDIFQKSLGSFSGCPRYYSAVCFIGSRLLVFIPGRETVYAPFSSRSLDLQRRTGVLSSTDYWYLVRH